MYVSRLILIAHGTLLVILPNFKVFYRVDNIIVVFSTYNFLDLNLLSL